GGLTAGGEGRYQDIVESRVAVREFLLELGGAGPQRIVGELLELLFERIDLLHARRIGLDPALVGGSENFAGERANHAGIPLEAPENQSIKSTRNGAADTTKPTFVAANRAHVHRSCHWMPELEQLSRGKRRLSGPDPTGFARHRSGLDPCQL